jgi:type III secretory pathway component EscV/tetratricopeptide (TPR) repeat protein
MLDSSKFQGFVDVAREMAERAHVEIAAANRAFEALRSASRKPDGPFELWTAIDEQIGRAEAPALQNVLIELRARYVFALNAALIDDVERALQRSLDAGWTKWLEAVAETISLFRLRFAIGLCEAPFAFPNSKRAEAEKIRTAVSRMSQARWPEAYETLDLVAKQEFLPDAIRAKLLVICGQIQLYHFQSDEGAKRCLDMAKRLAPRDGRVLSGLGDYWRGRKDKDIKRAESYYDQAIETSPTLPHGYIGRGECSEDRQTFDIAESWYQRAIAKAPGSASVYEKLLKLYGRPDQFKSRESDFERIVTKISVLDPEDQYPAYCDLGDIYLHNDRFDEAQEWYEKAIALDPTRPDGHIALAFGYEKQMRMEDAVAEYEKAIEGAPSCYDGYWALTSLYEQQGNWLEALRWYEQAPQWWKEWANLARARVGEMHWKLGELEQAETLLKKDLRDDDNNKSALDVLESIADHYCRRRQPDEAKRVYREIFEIVGDSYKPTYHNRLGDMHYFLSESGQAAEEYRQAVAAAPNNALSYRNLAGAYRELKEFEKAKKALDAALHIDRNEKADKTERSLLLNAEGNDLYERGDYQQAQTRYAKAIEFSPRDDVLHANLGRALEQMRTPGERKKELEDAIEAFTSGRNLSRSDVYEKDIERLRVQLEFASRYGQQTIGKTPVVTAIAVEVAKDLIESVVDKTRGGLLSDHVSNLLIDMRWRIKERFGVHLPGVRFRGNEGDLENGSYVIMIMEIPLVLGNVDPKHRFFRGSKEDLLSLGLMGHIIRHLEAVIEDNLVEFLGHQEVAKLVEAEDPGTLERLRANPKKLSALVAVCKGLAAEGVPVRPFAKILEAFERQYSKQRSLQDIVERIRFLPDFRSKLPGNDERLTILPLSRHFEVEIRNSVYRSGAYAVLAMEPERCQSVLAAVRKAVEDNSPAAILVETPDWRPFVRSLIEIEFPHVPVLSRRELKDGFQAKTAGMIDLDNSEPAGASPFWNRSVETPTAMPEDSWENEALESSDAAITVFINEARKDAISIADGEPLALMQEGLFYELGIILPQVRVEIDDRLAETEFRISLNKQEYSTSRGLEQTEFLISAVEKLRELIREHAAMFQTVPVTKYMLDSLSTISPVLIESCRKRFTDQRMCRVLRELLNEEISIRDLRSILESLLSINGTINVDLDRYIEFSPHADNLCLVNEERSIGDLTPADYSNFVRASRKRYISHKFTAGRSTLPVYLLDRELERKIRESGGQPPDLVKTGFIEAVRREVGDLSSMAERPVLLTSMDIRRTVRKLIEAEFPKIAVLSYQELSPDSSILPKDNRISFDFPAEVDR